MLNCLTKMIFAKNLCNLWQTGIRHSCKLPSITLNNGNEMPMIGLGTWSSTNDFLLLEKVDPKKPLPECDSQCVKSNSEKVAKAVGWAIDVGYRHIDCAHLYKNQREIGQVLKQKIDSKVISRENFFITSKLWNTCHDPENVCSACKQTLDEFNVDYVDMYLMHTPMGFQYSKDLFPMSEGKLLMSDVDYIDTWCAMEDLVGKKMCKNIGISNFNVEQIERLLKNCKIIPQTLQIELHPYLTQKKLIEFAKSKGISITAYAPLGSPDRPWAAEGEARALLTDKTILQLAEKYKRTAAQILLRYQIDCGHIVIPKATEKNYIEENINIFDFELCPKDVKRMDNLDRSLRFFGFTGAAGHPHHPFEKKEKTKC